MTTIKWLFDPETGQLFKSTDLFDHSGYEEFKIKSQDDVDIINAEINRLKRIIIELHSDTLDLMGLTKEYRDGFKN